MLGTISFFCIASLAFSFAEMLAMAVSECEENRQVLVSTVFGILFAFMATYILIERGVLEWAVK